MATYTELKKQLSSDAGLGAQKQVANTTDLEVTGNKAGDLAYATTSNKLLFFNGSSWLTIGTPTNATPTISAGGDAEYTLDTVGTAVVVTITASDVEQGTNLTYTHSVTAGSLTNGGGTTATVVQGTGSNTNQFTITPSTNPDYEGTFSLTFTVSDGINTATSASAFTLIFETSGLNFLVYKETTGTPVISPSVKSLTTTATNSPFTLSQGFKAGTGGQRYGIDGTAPLTTGGLTFDGNGDAITIPASADFAFGTGDFSIEAYVKSTTHTNYPYIYDGRTSPGSSSNAPALYIHNDNTLRYYVAGAARITVDYSDYDNKFTHIALQRSSGVTYLYLDGVEKGTWTDTTDYTDQGPVVIGRHGDSSNATYCLNGTLSNMRVLKGAVGNTITAGTPGGLDFTGTGYTSLASNSAHNFGTNDFTIEFFYKWDSNSGYQTLVDQYYTMSSQFAIQSNTGTYKWALWGTNISGAGTYESTNATQGVWHHYAIVRNGSTIKMYRDAVETLSLTGNSSSIGGTNVTHFSENTHEVTGMISNYRVVLGTALYTSAGFTIPTANLTAISGTSLLLFQENSGSTLSDGSSNNITVTKDSGHNILTSDGPFSKSSITMPTTDLTAVTNTKLLTANKATAFSSLTNGSYYFGSTSNTHLKSGTSSDFTLGTSNDFTVEYWYKFPSSVASGGYMFDMGSNIFTVYAASTNRLDVWGTGGTVNQGGTGVGVTSGVWYHMAIQRSGNVHTFYIDGQLQDSKTDSSNSHNFNGTSITINNYGGGGGYGLNCYYSDFRLVKGTAVYSGAFTPPSGPLTKTGGTYPSTTNVNTSIPSGHTKLLTAQNSSGGYVDNSDSAHTLTATGTVTVGAGIDVPVGDDSTSSHSITAVNDVSVGVGAITQQDNYHSVTYPTANPGADFDGSNDYVDVAASSQFAFGDNEFSIDGWIRTNEPSADTQHRRIFMLDGPTGDNSDNVSLAIENSGGKFKTIDNNDNLTGLTNIGDNVWHHFQYNKKGGFETIHIDGIPEGQHAHSGNVSNLNSGSPRPRIGAYSSSTGRFDGEISNIRVTNGGRHVNMTGGVYFDGSSDSLEFTASSDFTMGTGDWTVELFYNADYDITGSTNYYLFDMGGNKIRVKFHNGVIYGSPINGENVTFTPSASLGETTGWHHLALVRNGSTFTLYFDGISKGTLTTSSNHTTNTLRIGGYDSSGYEWKGWVSNFRVVKGTAVYTGDSFTVPASALTAISNTKLLTCQNAAATAITNGAYHFTTTSSRLTTDHADFDISSSTPFTIEYWYYFVSSSNSTPIFDLGIGNQFQTYLISGNQKVYSSPGGGYIIDLGSGASGGFQNGVWHHLALTGDGSGNIKAYLDGVQKGSTYNKGSAWAVTGGRVRLNGYAGSGYTTVGENIYLSDFRLVNGTEVYTGNFSRPSGALTTTGGTYPSTTNVNTSIPAGHTKLLTCQNSSGSFVDNSGNGHTFTEDGTVNLIAGVEDSSTTDASSSAHSITQAGDAANFGCTPFRFSPPDRQPESDSDTKLLMLRETTGSSLSDNSSHNHSLTNNGSITAGLTTNPFLTDLMFFPQPYGRLYDFSIEYFAKFNQQVSGSTTYYPIVVSNTSASATTLQIMHDSTTGSASKHKNYIYFGTANSGTTLIDDDDGVETTDTNWHHYLLQRQGNQLEFYRGGFLKSGQVAVGGSGLGSNQLNAAIGDKNAVMKLGHDGGSNFSRASVSNFRIKKGLNSYTPDYPAYGGSITGGPVYKILSSDILGTAAGTALSLGTGAWTIEAWINTSSTSWSLIDFSLVNGTHDQFVTDSGNSYAGHSDGSAWNSLSWWSGSDNGVWNHIAYVAESSTVVKIYKNGVLRETYTSGASTHYGYDENDIFIGRRSDGYYRDSSMKLSNLRIVKGTAVYTGAFTPPTSALTAVSGTALLAFQQSTGSPVDRSGNNVTLTAVEAGTASTDSPFGGKVFTPPTDELM